VGDAGALLIVVFEAPFHTVMYHEMSNEIGHDNGSPTKGGDAPSCEVDVLAAPSSVFRNQHLAHREQVVNELKKCHAECDNMAALVNGVRLMYDLKSQFTFKDALLFTPQSSQDAADRALNALKGKISAAVRSVAGQADTLCTTAEEREAFSNRLERQFGAIRTKLIQDETKRTVEKLLGLCARVEGIVEQLSGLGSPSMENRDLLEVMAHSLRLYIRDTLGQPVVRTARSQQSQPSGRELQAELSVADFFDRLDTLTVETYNSLRDQAAV
jgi:hypothetical protein